MSRQIRQQQRRLGQAQSYRDYLEHAAELDRLSGAEAWREADDTPELAPDLLRRDIQRIAALRRTGDLPALGECLHESIYRHQGDIVAPHLYTVARTGTKRLIEDYLDEVAQALKAFVDTEHPELDRAARRKLLADAHRNLGQPALLLSGGAAMGFFHLGVIKALFEQGLLPDVLCGSSIGSMVGGGVCVRNDEELRELFGDLDAIYRFGIRFLQPAAAWRQRSLLDQRQYTRCVRENIGEQTFAEAAAHSGRHLCVSVSPARARQKPRVLSARTAPAVRIDSAVVASSAIPGLFPPVTLQMAGADGGVQPYLPAERWVDGSFQGDLPTKRLGRLYNVNHFVVSQVNPHAVPFLATRASRGLLPLATDLLLSSARAQTAQLMKVVQARIKRDAVYNVIEHARLIAEQDYRGDTNIHPPVSGWMYRRLLSNPTVDDLQRYILLGERATWPKLALIRNQTRIRREIADCLRRLDGED